MALPVKTGPETWNRQFGARRLQTRTEFSTHPPKPFTASRTVSLLFIGFLVTGCDSGTDAPSNGAQGNKRVAAELQRAASDRLLDTLQNAPPRPADFDRIMQGATSYAEHCATCHGPRAEGVVNWQRRDASGNFPPPPLNGTAHTWHHPRRQLANTIKSGGRVMPAFGEKLDDNEIDQIIDWLLTLWPEEVYALWAERNEEYERRVQ